MASKKIPIGLNPAEAELEHRVEAMMEPVKISVVHHDEPSAAVAPVPAAPPIDIFSDPKTAPQVPAGLAKKLAIKAAPEVKRPKPITVVAHEPVEQPELVVAKPIVVSVTNVPSAPPLPSSEKVAEPAPEPEPAQQPEVETAEVLIEAPAKEPKSELLAIPEFEPDDDFEEPELAPVEPAVAIPQLVKSRPTIIPRKVIEPLPGPQINDVVVPPLQIDDATTDAAVDSITATEGDELLAAQDAVQRLSNGSSQLATAKKPWSGKRKLWTAIAIVLLAIIIPLGAAAAIPTTRYKIAGLVVKNELQVAVLDSTTMTPVSKATVTVDGHSITTDGKGMASLEIGVGSHTVSVSKQYYKDQAATSFVDFKDGKPLSIKLVATGRQVPISVVDMLTGKPVANVDINVLNTNAKTDKNGKAIIVLPTKTATVDGQISAPGFNKQAIKVTITDTVTDANKFSVTPAGVIYFLSNEQGTIDIVKANLDGSGRKVVLKGTGKEDPNTTVLLASRDWRYAVLKAQRNSTQASLFLLDASTDKVTEFDSGDANFTPIGWMGHNFVYDAVRNAVATSQNGHEVIKSYDADRLQMNLLDQSQAEASGDSYIYQGFYNFYVLESQLVYNLQWFSSGGADLSKKSNAIRSVQPSSQNKKDLSISKSNEVSYIQSALAAPDTVYYVASNFNDGKSQYYEFKNGSAKESAAVTQASFNKLYPNYVASPTGQQVAWSELRDGKQTILVGNSSGNDAKVIGSLTGYKVYGWYSANYLLVTKNNSELYIAASTGEGTPKKLTDYYKPTQSAPIYGSGYGSL